MNSYLQQRCEYNQQLFKGNAIRFESRFSFNSVLLKYYANGAEVSAPLGFVLLCTIVVENIRELFARAV